MTRRLVNVDDFARQARKRLPRIFADYIDGGAFSETTVHRNRTDFDAYALRQRVLQPLTDPDISVDLKEVHSALPFGPGPVGFLGLYRRNGDTAVAKAAARAKVPFVLSTFSINGPATIARETGVAPDFQFYIDQDPEVNAFYLDQCKKAGVSRLFLTVDTGGSTVRERDVRNGFRAETHITPHLAWQFAKRPFWSLDLLRNGFPGVELVKDRPEFGKGALAHASTLAGRLDRHLTWDKVQRLHDAWGGSLIVKGLSDPEDAALARKAGVDGIVLSNHGGRQLDHGSSTISRLPEVRAALGKDLLLYIDGGFRRGSDILKAVALGADFVLMGRPFAWATAVAGEQGAAHLIDLLRTETEFTLQLMGLSSLSELKALGKDALLPTLPEDHP